MADWTMQKGEKTRSELEHNLLIYALLNLGGMAAITVSQIVHGVGNIRAAKRLHSKLLNAVLRAPLSFFEKTPMGRITNRFSNVSAG